MHESCSISTSPGFRERLELGLGLLVEILRPGHVDLVDDDEDQLVGEERLDALEELHLGLHGVPTLFGQVHEVEDGGAEMGDGGDGLHLDGIHLLERVVEDSRGVNGLESEVFVVEVADEQALGRERIRLYVDVRSRNALQETRLAHVGVPADEQRPRVRVDGRQATQMLAHLVEVQEGVLEPAAYGGHASQSGALELLALEKRLGVFEQADIVARHDLYEMLGGGQLTQGDAEVVGVVERVEQVLVERVDVLEPREAIEDERELLGEGLLCEFDLAGVKIWEEGESLAGCFKFIYFLILSEGWRGGGKYF